MIGRVRRYEAHGYEAHGALDDAREKLRQLAEDSAKSPGARAEMRQQADVFFAEFVRIEAPTGWNEKAQAKFDAFTEKARARLRGTTDSASRDRSSTSDGYARGQAAAMLEDLDAAGITVAKRDDPHYVMGVHRVAKELGRIGSSAREDSAGTFDPVDDMLGGYDLFGGFAPHRDSDDDSDGQGEVEGAADARDALVARQKDAWKPGMRKRDQARPGAVTDPQSSPFGGASRASTAAGQNAINASSYAPRELDEQHGEGALEGASAGTGYGGFGAMEGMPGDDQGDGDVQDAADAMVARAKAAWLPQNRKKRGDGASASAGISTGEDVDPQVEMVERARLAGLQPLRRVRQ
jgi:hypothetical protein